MFQPYMIGVLILLAYSVWVSWALYKRTNEKWDAITELARYKHENEGHSVAMARIEENYLAETADSRQWREYFRKKWEEEERKTLMLCIVILLIQGNVAKAEEE